jgi:hypothetical protein
MPQLEPRKLLAHAWGGAMVLAIFAGTALADTPRQDFNAALQKWRAAGLRNYAFTFYQSCFCIGRQPIRISVENDKVRSARNISDGAAVKPAEVGQPLTMNDIFQKIEAGYTKPADHIRLTLNPELGYPERVYIDYVEMMADEELSFTISDFTH